MNDLNDFPALSKAVNLQSANSLVTAGLTVRPRFYCRRLLPALDGSPPNFIARLFPLHVKELASERNEAEAANATGPVIGLLSYYLH